jgi:hypothetical protein
LKHHLRVVEAFHQISDEINGHDSGTDLLDVPYIRPDRPKFQGISGTKYGHIWYLHFRILKFPLPQVFFVIFISIYIQYIEPVSPYLPYLIGLV